MRITYQVLSYLICVLVAVQSAVHAWSSAGIVAFLSGGGVVDVASEEPPMFPEFAGIIIHGVNGMYVIPVVALALLIVSFFAKLRHGILVAAIAFVLVLLQILLGMLSFDATIFGLLHGLNALVLFAVAFWGGAVVSSRRNREARGGGGAGVAAAGVNGVYQAGPRT